MGSLNRNRDLNDRPDFFKRPRIINAKAMKECVKTHPCCRVCGSNNEVSAHHIHSRGARGDDHLNNLISLCWNCHRHAEDGIYLNKDGKVEYISARNYMISVLEMINEPRYAKALEYLRSRNENKV